MGKCSTLDNYTLITFRHLWLDFCAWTERTCSLEEEKEEEEEEKEETATTTQLQYIQDKYYH